MKKNMIMAMDRLDIDDGIRDIIGRLWKHGYRTFYSCQGGIGHSDDSYVTFFSGTGDGWFEKRYHEYGFFLDGRNKCCSHNEIIGENYCPKCGAGLNGHVRYSKP